MQVLGLDPGLCTTGWGIIRLQGNRLTHVAHGIIKTPPADPLPNRLTYLYERLSDLIKQHMPDAAAVEETFVNKNPASALKLGMARGVVLMVPAAHGLVVGEYAANKVKKAVVGVGHADKAQVAMMVQRLLSGCGPVKADAADALAVAICHAHYG